MGKGWQVKPLMTLTKLKLTHADVLKSVRDLLKRYGVFHYKHAGGPFNQVGVSDIIGMTRTGRFFAIEVKRPGDQLTEKQRLFLDAVRHHGGIAVVAIGYDAPVQVAKALELPVLF